MNPGLTAYLIVCPLVFLSGVVDAIGGGGGIISLPAYLLAGLPPQLAIGSNKLSSAVGTTVSTAIFVRRGFVDMKPALFFIASALAGAALGARLALMVPDDILRYGLLVVLPIVALVVFKRKDFALTKKEAEHPRFALALFFAFIIGMYDGFYGPGTGTFLILSLTGVAGYAIHHAVGYTKVINLSSNVSSLIVFLANGRVVIPLAGAAIIFSVAGQYIGAKLVLRDGQKIVRPVIVIVLLLLFIKVFYDTVIS